MARLGSDTSVLGPSTRIVGRVTGKGVLRVEGSLQGDLDVSGDAEIALGGSVEGNVSARSLDVSGSLLGDAVIEGPVTIRSGATVRGELRGSEVSIEPGSRVSVKLETELELSLGPAPRRR
ncbi:MAG TPA: polymer-forming cytoskeletal protein [Polyangiaceae bacterium]